MVLAQAPVFAKYEQKSGRVIPVATLAAAPLKGLNDFRPPVRHRGRNCVAFSAAPSRQVSRSAASFAKPSP